MLLSHKSMSPDFYAAAGSPGDSFFGDTGYQVIGGQLTQTSAIGLSPIQVMFDHQRLIVAPVFVNSAPQLILPYQDTTGDTLQVNFGSPHIGGMPTLYADGSVRGFSYSTPGTSSAGQNMVWPALWCFNDGVTVTGND
jgi:prepilin-type processing-associated H-X9-DG protein